jgi:sugar phosphate isomerase/epimerase
MTKAKWSIDLGRSLGVHVVVLHASDEPISDHERSKYIAQAKISLTELVPITQRSNVMLAVELLPRICIGNSPSELKTILDNLPKDRIGICLDMNHVKKTNSLPRIIHELSSRLITVHISDFDGIDTCVIAYNVVRAIINPIRLI